jgi:hypothetical protein
MVYFRVVLPVVASHAHLPGLRGHWPKALLASGAHLRRSRTRPDSAATAVEADAVSIVAYDRAVNVGVVNHGGIHVHYGGVVGETISLPASAVEALAVVAVAVIHSTVKAYLRAPVAVIPFIASVVPSPVAGRPEQAGLWRRDPCSWNPVVAIIAPRPVAGSPNVVGIGALGLLVNRQFGGRDGDRNSDLGKGDAGRCKQHGYEEGVSEPAKKLHRASFGPRSASLPVRCAGLWEAGP